MAGSEVVIVDEKGTEHVFPSGFDPVKAAAIVKGGTPPPTSSMPMPSVSDVTAVARAALPLLQTGAEHLATDPNLPKIGSMVGRVIGGAAPVVGGAAELGPAGALLGVGGISKGAWAGGKTGWFTAKLLQSASAPVAKMLEAVAPYMSATSAIAAGGDAVNRLNTPEGVAQFAKSLNPVARQKLVEHYHDQPTYLTAIKSALGVK